MGKSKQFVVMRKFKHGYSWSICCVFKFDCEKWPVLVGISGRQAATVFSSRSDAQLLIRRSKAITKKYMHMPYSYRVVALELLP